MTPALRQFLADWLAWAEAGAPEHPVFRQDCGLCTFAGPFGVLIDLTRALKHNFKGALFPFGGPEDYWARNRESTQHENPARLAWVRQQLGVEG